MIGSNPIAEASDDREMRQRLAARDEVTRILGGSSSLATACPAIFEAICTNLSWEWAALWSV